MKGEIIYMNNNKSIKETLLESKDRSSLDNNFKLKKLDDKIEFVKFPSDKAIKYMRNNNRLNDEDFINYCKKTRVGELAIDKTNGQVAGYIFENRQSNRIIDVVYKFKKLMGRKKFNRKNQISGNRKFNIEKNQHGGKLK